MKDKNMITMKKVSISAQMPMHSYQVGTALAECGLLDRYYSSVYNDNSILYRLMERFLPKNISERVTKKRCETIDKYVIKYCEFEGLLFVGGSYLPIIRNHKNEIITHMNKRFGKRVGKDLIRRKTDVVIAYDTYAKGLFSYLIAKKAKTIKILDMASASARTIYNIIQEECKKDYPILDTMIGNVEYAKQLVLENIKEIKLADYFLAGSQFVVNSLLETGVHKEQIKLVPYGIDVKKFYFKQKIEKIDDSLIFLFVGRVQAAKGIWYLLEAFNDPRVKCRNVKLKVVGDIRTNKENLTKYKENVVFEGLKLPSEMPSIYENSDIFVLPSLWEGFSLSMLESMSCGLPIIVPKNLVCEGVVTDYKDGILIQPADIETIVQAIIWFDEHRSLLPLMSKAAREKVKHQFTLEKYYERLQIAVNEIIAESN